MTARHIKLWTKNTVECNWRTVHIEKICYTLIHRTFTYGVNSFEQTFISALGMKEAVKKRKLDSRVKSVRNSLPDGAADAMVLPENFYPKDITTEVTDDGDLGFMELYVITCKKCHMSETGFMQYFITKCKALLPEDPKLADIIDNWDKIIAKHSGEMIFWDVFSPIRHTFLHHRTNRSLLLVQWNMRTLNATNEQLLHLNCPQLYHYNLLPLMLTQNHSPPPQ